MKYATKKMISQWIQALMSVFTGLGEEDSVQRVNLIYICATAGGSGLVCVIYTTYTSSINYDYVTTFYTPPCQ